LPSVAAEGERVIQLAAGQNFTCAVTDGKKAYCWGRNSEGQLGTGDKQERLEPTDPVLLEGVLSIAAGERHACAVTESGAVFCWGANDFGQVGKERGYRGEAFPYAVAGLNFYL
jgi:alpha-tubulin suppressor-like RCC1 family protein